MDGMAFAYWGPASSDQQRFTAARTAALVKERERRKTSPEYTTVDTTTTTTTDYIERSISIDSAKSEVSGATALQQNYGHMDPIRRSNTTGSGSSSSSEADHRVCSPQVTQNVPHKVLEVGCGSAYWSAACHDYFCTLGYTDVAFTGLDVAPLPPNLNKQGINWTFVQHDLRRMPLPFDDEEFDLVMLKDLSLVLQIGVPFQKFLDENIRLLRVGGTLEIWESDHVLRSLLPHPPPMSKQLSEQRVADQTATFLIAPGTPFAPAQNKFLQQANAWIQEALDARRLPPTPCARIAQVLYQEPDCLSNVGMRRVAIPLGELRWERDSHKHTRSNSDVATAASKKKGKAKLSDSGLTLDQLALRQTALLTVLQMIESLEPLLKEVSGKNSEEWSYWWASMMADLLDPSDSSKAASTGEVLEVGAWWATKLASD
ncbi:hypothetical protein LTR91_022192 [Friedmanniomyces endolithicus]|uniref:Methyltransferase domain-containing protein n=1 Tax=Friedmanniomyces endolithicus TaxID=329885 RepID=A0AAN6H8R9_9PEZI|nr:hypothetical protein LTR57_019898 [Friedmanniomyces endolithicus]KAK0956811.1 hypothetical protein LTR91_022192 [Friedmanniomyces endolithicus]KAK0982322.1 hypothetical protein LTS01_011422 [Friedmanniomyces endolithicus]